MIASHDSNLLITAKRHGIPVHHVSDDWLRPPEPHPKDSENARLRSELAVLKSEEPQFEITMDLPAERAAIFEVEPLTPDEQSDLREALIGKHPRPPVPTSPVARALTEPGEDARHDKYEDVLVPAHCQNLHTGLELVYGQVPVTIGVKNIGQLRADNLIIEVEIAGGWFNKRVIMVPNGPRFPERESFIPMLDHSRIRPAHSAFGPHDLREEIEPKCSFFRVECADFRHGSAWRRDGVLILDPRYARDLTVIVTVTAANKRGTEIKVGYARKTATKVRAAELIDLATSTFRVAPSIHDHFQKLLTARKFEKIEIYEPAKGD